ncbi:DUF6427 family protein [Tenacibaculum sp. MEBiC06402]|uniref:DUF6427 family protein n=1 Tax=unclassified Tenacibaculum TaxID=2635139 RepID=UPI003B9D39CB
MLTNFFSNTKPFTSVMIIVLFFCYALSGYFGGFTSELSFSLFFWFFVLFGLINFIKSRNNLTFDNSYFFLIYVILIGYVPITISVDTIFYSNLILLVYVRRVYSLQSSKNTLKKLFDSGLWMGISFLIEPFTIVVFPLTFIAIILHQHIDYRRLITPLLGFISPIIIYFTYCFWYEQQENFNQLFNYTTFYDFSMYNEFLYKLSLSVILVLTFFSFLLKTPKALSVKNVFRKNWILVCLHLLSVLILFLIIRTRTGAEITYLFFPCAIIIANGFELIRKKWLADIFMILLFIGSLICYII